MTFKQATAQLTSLTYVGISTKYDLIELPAVVNGIDLPALVLLPEFIEGEVVKAFDVNNTNAQVMLRFRHLLLIAGVGHGRIEDRYDSLMDWLDVYVTAIKTDWLLNDNLLYPMQIKVAEFGIVYYGGVAYIGIEFVHQWTAKV